MREAAPRCHVAAQYRMHATGRPPAMAAPAESKSVI
jgi:hypothetical protein